MSGVVSATRALDREEINPTTGSVLDQYNLKVIATDGGTQPHSTMTTVVIYVDDVNDNTPLFPTTSFVQVINNPTQTGTCILPEDVCTA